MHNRTHTSPTPALDLPPPFRLVTLREVGDAFVHATTIAAEAGAGTLVHVGRFDLVNSRSCWSRKNRCGPHGAPSTPAWWRSATRCSYMRPPDRTISFAWPDAIRIDGGLIGGGRLAWPAEAIETEPPEWLVFGASIRTVAMGEVEAGLRPLSAALDEEGFEDLGSGRLVEGFARHLMVAVDAWRANEFATVTRTYLHHLTTEKGAIPAFDAQWRSADAMARPGGTRPARSCRRTRSAVVARPGNRGAAHMKLLRTIRLDPSDTFVFERAAEPGEWAVSGAFAFAHLDAAKLEGKARAAFRSGFLGIDSLGWSTLVQIVEASNEDRASAVELLARRLVERFGAPDLATARPAAEEEIAFAASLSDHPKGMLAAVSRKHENGAIREAFRTLTPSVGPKPLRAYAFLEVAGKEEPPQEHVDLMTIAKGERT